jgi:hypothetical protein
MSERDLGICSTFLGRPHGEEARMTRCFAVALKRP